MASFFLSPVVNLLIFNLDKVMLCWSSTYLAVVLIAALFGFINMAASLAGAAKIIFFIFTALFFGALVLGENNSKKMKG